MTVEGFELEHSSADRGTRPARRSGACSIEHARDVPCALGTIAAGLTTGAR